MKIKSFKEHLETRLNQKEIYQIEVAAQAEYASLKALQKDISQVIAVEQLYRAYLILNGHPYHQD